MVLMVRTSVDTRTGETTTHGDPFMLVICYTDTAPMLEEEWIEKRRSKGDAVGPIFLIPLTAQWSEPDGHNHTHQRRHWLHVKPFY